MFCAVLFYVAVGVFIVSWFVNRSSGSSQPSGSVSPASTGDATNSSNSRGGSPFSPSILIGGAVVGSAIFLALAWLGGQRHGNDWFPKSGPSVPYQTPAEADRIYRSQFANERERLDFEAQQKAREELRRDAPTGRTYGGDTY